MVTGFFPKRPLRCFVGAGVLTAVAVTGAGAGEAGAGLLTGAAADDGGALGAGAVAMGLRSEFMVIF